MTHVVSLVLAATRAAATTRAATASLAEPLELLPMMRHVLVSPTAVRVMVVPRLTVAASVIVAAAQIVALSHAITWLIHRLSIATATKWIIILIISHAARSLSLRHIVSFAIASSIAHHLILRVFIVKVSLEAVASPGRPTANFFPIEVVLIVLRVLFVPIRLVRRFRHRLIFVVLQ